MKTPQCRVAALFGALLLWLGLNQAARAVWERIEVDAHLDNSGALHVRERMSVTAEGKMTTLSRKVATSTDQAFILRRLVREEDGKATEFAGGGWDQKNRYMWRDQTLTWWIRDATDPEWNEQSLVYRLDYELRNAVTPEWDIPAARHPLLYCVDKFPEFFGRLRATMAAWGRAPASFDRRYRLEHDVILPQFPEWPVKEFIYTLHYGEAWRRVDPKAEIGRRTPDSDYRVTQLLDYLPPGWPPGFELRKSATRVGSIFGFATLAGFLWVIVATGAIRRWGLIRPPLDRRWFEGNIGSQPPEIFARLVGKYRGSQFVAPFLERLRANGVIGVRSEPGPHQESAPTVHLQLLRDAATLQRHEQLMVAALFPQGPKSGSALLAQFYAKPGFSPGGALDEAIDADGDKSKVAEPTPRPRRSLFWRMIRRLSPWVCCTAAALLVVDSIQDQWPMDLFMSCWPIVCALMLAAAFYPLVVRLFERLISAGIAALVTLMPVLVAVMAMLSIQFCRNIPVTAPGSAGVALVGLWFVGALFYIVQGTGAPEHRIATLGAFYAGRELRKRHPQLDDTWIPHLTALGLESQVTDWRARESAAGAPYSAVPVTTEPGYESARPFTGIAPFSKKEKWIDALYVPSEEERQEEEKAAREDDEEEEKNGEEK